MMASRGMGAIRQDKVPSGKKMRRKDGDKYDDNGVEKQRNDGDEFTMYAKAERFGISPDPKDLAHPRNFLLPKRRKPRHLPRLPAAHTQT